MLNDLNLSINHYAILSLQLSTLLFQIPLDIVDWLKTLFSLVLDHILYKYVIIHIYKYNMYIHAGT